MTDLLLRGARVVDPETGLDAVRHVGVTGDKITSVSVEPAPARRELDLSGRVLAPGFIDLHSHAQTVSSLRMQALDGVTTALELESGAAPVRATYDRASDEGRPINFGYSASWAMARMRVLDGAEPDGGFESFAALCGGVRWRDPATPAELDRVVAELEGQLHQGALGIGVLLGYAPQTGRKEYFQVARLAARYDVPTFTHARFKNPDDPETALEGIAEVVAAASGTGAHMHLCHINSTSLRAIDEVGAVVTGAREHGLRVSTEAYPYGAGMTTIGVPFLHPGNLARVGITPSDLVLLSTGERPRDAARLTEIQRTDPGAMVAIHYLDEDDPADWSVLERALLLPDTAIASDAIPFATPDGNLVADAWPLPADAMSHPRTSGTFCRFLGAMVRESGLLTLIEAVRRCTLQPAEVMSAVAPQFRRKGRVQVGADADLVVFDLDAVSDRSTYAEPGLASAGVDHLLVGGEFVVRGGEPLPEARPGRAVKGRLG
ncbi:amidohydrolase family protein [Actinomadura sp. HBU206391]|uniref:amidohydrolase family protein n=1 Tax=Actinomadura sp. HBU206391 TaxID=2731692 RepID=UPI002905F18C|nr:amidohydrolase family protein [Actinomadura sp. HBU206391]